ncbi:MAG: DUF5657 family protein [Microgenomates group bacterium]
MTPFDNFLNFLINFFPQLNFWGVIKIFVIIAFFLYLGFALIIVRQVGLMSKTLDGGFKTQIKILSWIHLIAAVLMLFICFWIL